VKYFFSPFEKYERFSTAAAAVAIVAREIKFTLGRGRHRSAPGLYMRPRSTRDTLRTVGVKGKKRDEFHDLPTSAILYLFI